MDQWITGPAAGHRTFAGKLADRQSQTMPSEDPDYGDLGPAFPAWTGPGREPILQPPKPEISPSPQILQRAMDRRLGSRGLTVAGREMTTMTATGIHGVGPSGVLRMTWIQNRLGHVLEHSDVDGRPVPAPGPACPVSGSPG